MQIENTKSYLNQVHYFKKVKDQINKDFNDIELEEQIQNLNITDSNQLFSLIEDYLIALFNQQTERFFQLMYRIDIPDKDLKLCIHNSKIDGELITLTVIKRELLKVLLREKFS